VGWGSVLVSCSPSASSSSYSLSSPSPPSTASALSFSSASKRAAATYMIGLWWCHEVGGQECELSLSLFKRSAVDESEKERSNIRTCRRVSSSTRLSALDTVLTRADLRSDIGSPLSTPSLTHACPARVRLTRYEFLKWLLCLCVPLPLALRLCLIFDANLDWYRVESSGHPRPAKAEKRSRSWKWFQAERGFFEAAEICASCWGRGVWGGRSAGRAGICTQGRRGQGGGVRVAPSRSLALSFVALSPTFVIFESTPFIFI